MRSFRRSEVAKDAPKSAMPLQSIQGIFSTTTDATLDAIMDSRSAMLYHKMSESDAICGAVLLALTKIFQNIEWKVYNDPQDILAESMDNVKWTDSLEDILSMFVYGHSLMETTLKKVGSRVLWDKMFYRPQTTLMRWRYKSDGKLDFIEQMNRGKLAKIKAHKCLLFNTSKSQANPLGKSLFRNAHRDWHYKTNIEQIEAIGIERDLTGLPVLTAPESENLMNADGSLSPLGQWAWNVVRNVKKNKQEGLVLPSGWDFELAGSPGKRQFDLNDSISRYSNNMALSMLSQFLVLGVTNSSGSFALAKEQSSLFYIACEGFANSVANVVNNQFIGATALSIYNNLPDKPYIKPVGIERIELNDLASFLGRLLKYNIITPDDKLEEYLRDRVALPPRDSDSSRIADVKLAYEDDRSEESTEEETEEVNKDTPEGEDETDAGKQPNKDKQSDGE